MESNSRTLKFEKPGASDFENPIIRPCLKYERSVRKESVSREYSLLGHWPTDISPNEYLADGRHFAERSFARRTFERTDI